jgi:hypothetical protein
LDTVATDTPASRATAANVVRLALTGIDLPASSGGDLSADVISAPLLRTESFEMFRRTG